MKDISRYVGDRIKAFREENGMTQEELADMLGITRQSISRYESGERKANQDILFEFSKIFETSINNFFPENSSLQDPDIYSLYAELNSTNKKLVYNYADRLYQHQGHYVEDNNVRYIVSGRQSAAGSMIEVDDTLAHHEVISSSVVPKGADELVEITGDSMEPLIQKGEKVYLRYQPTVENGEVAIVRIDNEGVTCKRVYYGDNEVVLRSENDEHEDMHYDASQVTILGKVLL